ncbi:MAG: hypothetical protein EP297_15050 [Gammaproteobacteria bacterium]|nr:MAG: hypothetical protein EP297_15050 [Gammaproteobacteria bacterium]
MGKYYKGFLTAVGIVIYGLFNPVVVLADSPVALNYEDDHLLVWLRTPSPDQITGFYQGRGFNQASIDILRQNCFISVHMKNKSRDVLWLDLNEWQILDHSGKLIRRFRREDWKMYWEKIGLILAHQSTFSWTQLPAVRDLRYDETVGGNLVIPWQDKPFKLIAIFRTGADKSGPERKFVFENIKCGSALSAE